MNQVEREVEAAVRRFYDGIETLISGGGVEALSEAWHHTDEVTARHPMDEWAIGWDQVGETWKVMIPFGRADRGGSKVLGVRTHVYGDVAYATVSFRASPKWGGEKLMCTNVLLRKDGVWKIIHHHADPSPAMQAALERMVDES